MSVVLQLHPALLLLLKMEDEAMSQGKQAASRSCRRQGNEFSSRDSRKTQPYRYSNFRPGRLTVDLGSPELYGKNSVFSSPKSVAMCYSSNRKLTQLHDFFTSLQHQDKDTCF